MKVYTSHFRQGDDPVLVAEGFSWAAAMFGFLWFGLHRAWIAAVLDFAAIVLLSRLCHAIGNTAPMLGYVAIRGLFGRDALRWGLARRGFTPGPIVTGADADAALARLLTAQAGQI